MELADEVAAIHRKLDVHTEILQRVEKKEDKTNGAVAALQSEQLQMEGAIGMLRWLVGIAVPLLAVGASVGGALLALIYRGA